VFQDGSDGEPTFATDPEQRERWPPPKTLGGRRALRAVHVSRTLRHGEGLPQRRVRFSTVPQPAGSQKGYNTPPQGRSYLPSWPWRPENRSWRCPCGKCTPATRRSTTRAREGLYADYSTTPPELNPARPLRGSISLLLYGFTYSWTLSSKFFSTFPHGTCLLSVSCQYLALDGVYHPLWAAISNNPTPRRYWATGTVAS